MEALSWLNLRAAAVPEGKRVEETGYAYRAAALLLCDCHAVKVQFDRDYGRSEAVAA